jgi:glycosyltransferase involved in cell wall biosynthesis
VRERQPDIVGTGALPVPKASAPLVSVVVPAFNAADFIADNIASVAGQTHRPIELLIVDDCSSDDTAAVVRELAAKYTTDDLEVRLLEHEMNQGCGAALRTGFTAAKGGAVCWLSADDQFIAPTKLALQLESAFGASPALSYYRGTAIGPDRAHAISLRAVFVEGDDADNDYAESDPAARLLFLMFRNPINGSSVMVPRRWLDYAMFDPAVGNVDQDGDLWMRYSALRLPFTALEGLALFNLEHAGQVSKSDVRMLRGMSRVRLRILMALQEAGRLDRIFKGSSRAMRLIFRERLYRGLPTVAAYLARLAMARGSGAPISTRLIAAIMFYLDPVVRGAVASPDYRAAVDEARELRETEEYRSFVCQLARDCV